MLNYRIYPNSGIAAEKPVLVFLHGLGGNSAIWMRQVRKLKDKYNLLLIDLPSHGKDNLKLSSIPNTYKAVAEQILEVLQFLNIQTATFIGCSIGTIFVKYLVLNHPEVVDKYVLIGGVGDLETWFKLGVHIAKTALFVLPASICYKAVSKIIIPKKEYTEGRELFFQCSKRIPPLEMRYWLSLLMKFPKLNRQYVKKLKDISNGLYITGEDDKLFLPMLSNELKKTKHKIFLKDCGHLCNLDKPDEVNQLIEEFIELQ